jgi:hypothetical protein
MKNPVTISSVAGRTATMGTWLLGRNALPFTPWLTSLTVLLAWLITGFVHANSQTNRAVNQVGSFELNDQHGQPHHYRFPKTNLSFVAVADRKGSTQIDAWVRPLKQRYGTKIDIDGVADVSAVPRLLRGMVTGKFRKTMDYPVMLDWTGTVCRQFAYRNGQVNVFALDRQGKILNRWAGPANEKTLRELFAELDRAKP